MLLRSPSLFTRVNPANDLLCLGLGTRLTYGIVLGHVRTAIASQGLHNPGGRHSRFVAGLLYLRLRVRPRPKSVDFPDVENQQWTSRTVIRREKDPFSVHLACML
ncbi:hypothetical protein TNCV_3035351 [Trichonephila clavipes]|nr:hypothetical protein TNCV_3035351 [Trichonephila clavipes]